MKIRSYDKEKIVIAAYGNNPPVVSHGYMELKKKRLWVPHLMIIWGIDLRNYKKQLRRFIILFEAMYGGQCKFVTETQNSNVKAVPIAITTVYTRGHVSFKRKLLLVEKTMALISMTELNRHISDVVIYATMKLSRKRLEEYLEQRKQA